MEGTKKLLKHLTDFVGRLSASQVMMLLGVIAGTLVGVVFLVGWLNTVTYTRLYSDLDEQEAGEIAAWLNDNKIEYQLTNGGRTIEVPSSDVYKTRIALATEGLPRNGSMGYSIFDKNNLGMTDFLQNLNFRRALEGELTKTIMQLDEVQAARVHIVMPKERLFREDQKAATASVVLKLKSPGGITKHQVAGISHLVASSVEGLTPDNITIVDYGGNMLSSGTDSDPVVGLSASQLELTQEVEKHLASKAQSMLDEVLGTGKSVVRIAAELNFKQLERTSELFDANNPSVRSEERTKTSSADSDKAPEDQESSSEDESETTITNYELNKTVEHVIDAMGTLDRMSIAVLVDGVYTPAADESGEMVYQPRSPEELDRLQSIVKNAVGFSQERNDQIEMVNIAFDRQNLDQDRQALDSMYTREFYYDIARKVGYFLLLAIALLWARKKLKKFWAGIGRIANQAPRTIVSPEPSAEQTEAESIEDKFDMRKRQPRLVDRMQEAAKEQPEEIARVIKTMMAD